MLVVWPFLEEGGKAPVADDGGELQMLKPRYVGRDSENRPFSLWAERAVQSASGTDVVTLVSPQGELTTTDGHMVTISARTGEYNQKTRNLLLVDDVLVYHDDGYELKTSRAVIETQTMNAWGEAPVSGQGPFGSIRAKGFRMTERGGKLVLTGPGQVTLTRIDY